MESLSLNIIKFSMVFTGIITFYDKSNVLQKYKTKFNYNVFRILGSSCIIVKYPFLNF